LVWSSTAPYFQLSDDSAISDTLPAAMTVYTNTAALAGPAPRFFVVQGLNATGQASEPSARLGVFSFNVFVGP